MRDIITMQPFIKIIRKILRPLKNRLMSLYFSGNNRYCPICRKTSRKLLSFGNPLRSDARCVHCNSLERHRLTWLFFTKKTDLFDNSQKQMLHIAPEQSFQKLFLERIGAGYLSADLFNPTAMVKMDITNIQYAENTFDVIYCSHVLEHVPDDREAMKEFYRVLKPNGWAILLVPILDGPTHEDISIIDPKARLKVYGQEDHVRKYGTDLVYLSRLKEAGFKVQIIEPSEFLDSEQIVRMGITKAAQNIYYCTK